MSDKPSATAGSGWWRNLLKRWERYWLCKHPEYCEGTAYCTYCHPEELK